jgi:hypothetical protein
MKVTQIAIKHDYNKADDLQKELSRDFSTHTCLNYFL